MAFFDQIQDIAKSVAVKTESIAKNVSEKAEAALEIQKLSSEISKEKHAIQEEYNNIGQKIYTSYTDADMEVPEFLAEHFSSIAASYEKIEELNQKISEIKLSKLSINLPKVTCPKCNHEILATAKFCPECGEKITKAVKEEAPLEAEVVQTAIAEEKSTEHIEEATVVSVEEKTTEDAAKTVENPKKPE